MQNWIRQTFFWLATLSVVIGGLMFWAVRQTQQVPDFYTRATRQHSAMTVEASRRLEAEVEQLQSSAARLGTWSAAFSDEQINSWLIEELPQQFPRLAALGASEPRIVIEDDRVLAAVRYTHGRIDVVVSCEVKVELTEQPNILAFRLQNLRAGALPLPLSKFLKGITKEAARGNMDVGWDMTKTGPIALVTIPSEDPRYALSPVVVESVIMYDGALLLSGHTGSLAHESFSPRGPVHQFVSYRPRDSFPGDQLSGDQVTDQQDRWSSSERSRSSTIR